MVGLAAFPGRGLVVRVALLSDLLAHFLLYEALAGNRWRANAARRGMRHTVFWGVTAALLFNAAAEVLFWIEFETRFNFIAVDYLVYTREVIGNIRESCPFPASSWPSVPWRRC